MTVIRTSVTFFLLALTLSLAATAAAQPLSGPEFIGIQPCRLADTRPGFGFSGAFGPPALVGGAPRNFPIHGQCGIPATAAAVAFNFTITQPAGAGHLVVWPAGGPFPPTSIVNYVANEDVANASDVLLGVGGAISVQSVAMTHLVIDVYGYFTDVEELPNGNTALGEFALVSNTTGGGNTALGGGALSSNTTGNSNAAVGSGALLSNTTGVFNTATGNIALRNNTTGNSNTATGVGRPPKQHHGRRQHRHGVRRPRQQHHGQQQHRHGRQRPLQQHHGQHQHRPGVPSRGQCETGSNNIHIGNAGAAADTAIIRIGTQGTQTATFIEGIYGVTPRVADALTVLIDSAGQLGTASSSRRVKTDIHDLGDQGRALHQLRPVSFRYRSHPPDGPPEYGLIAEEVVEIYPELVVLDKDGQPSGVRYHVLPAMLLNELQRQQRLIEAQQRELDALRSQARLIDELTARLSRLEGKGAAAER